jgi:hypothetical protein
MKDTDILITGGYGTVRRRVTADLAPDYAGRLVVADRSAEKAGQLVAELGYGVRGKIYGLPNLIDPNSTLTRTHYPAILGRENPLSMRDLQNPATPRSVAENPGSERGNRAANT